MEETTDPIRRLEEARRRVERAKRIWHHADPDRANQLYERYRAEEEYLARLWDLLTGEKAEANENAAPAGCQET
ncbi:hypothetical protein [Alicyclobacillus macrosporangiidus]|uniref:Uncharacterized protein n=1 Tax=Alicyclobacillus macrosporangiidus TaxID=392015 RepID=A0A1I7ICJ0_9BACL|nr:hypothetical protein [Alicyclobacillus macrosporangiidus]SFU70560.1 hypothetical protein SAMN05421543_106128 [Alicyclobacillus macrosporangiidus]